jgi:Flp pilus assembly protein TadD
LVGCESRLWHVLGETDRATGAIKAFETKKLPDIEERIGKVRWLIASASMYSAIDEHAEAETLYRQVTELAPESFPLLARELANQGRVADAVDACLSALAKSDGALRNVAVILAQVLAAGPHDADSSERAQPVIDDALAAHEADVDLLMSVAVLHVARQEDPQAIAIFERIVELAPLNPLALNNLATLLAEQPSERTRALELMNRAIKEHGRQPAFLDTLGTIQMRAGQASQAIASLEESVANGGADPRYYFHLAAAYQLDRQVDPAREALARSLDLGLEKQILTNGDQRLLQDLKRELAIEAEPRLESRAAGATGASLQAAIRQQHSEAA